MSNQVEKQFPINKLLNGLRAIGYSFSTAVADIIDNSISALATEIKIYSNPYDKNKFFCFLDNGCGMSSVELENAMLPGSDRSNKEETEMELGRFGLGLKSASLSQCRVFTVASKKFGKIRAMSFDLNVIEKENKLILNQLTEDEINRLPHINELEEYEHGTLVIWTEFDRIEGSANKFEESFNAAVSDSKKHVEFVFHRFYDQVQIYFNNRRIDKRDPFLTGSIGRQQTGRITDISINGSIIKVIPYTLPFFNSLTQEEKALLGNPKSVYDEQGIYLYRNKRLISWGSWMRMGIRSELNKLARVQIDIPSSLDAVWSLDVKKSSAKIPDKIKGQITAAIEDSIIRSKRTTRFPGVKEQSVECKVWDRINEHEGKIRYQINREMPSLLALENSIGENEKRLLDIVLSQIESYLPKYSINNDTMDALKIVNNDEIYDEEELKKEVIQIISMVKPEDREKTFNEIFRVECYKKLINQKDELSRRIFNND